MSGRLVFERWASNGWVVAAVLLIVVVSIQIAAGALESERGLYSDEAAHFMNGLLIRDYVHEAFGTNPLTFARDYYQAYPKIAPLMWPPLLHVALGLVLLPGWSPMPAAVLLLSACLTWTAWRLYFVTKAFAPPSVAIGVTGLFVVTPAVVDLASSVMIDTVIAALALEAAWWLGRYFESARRRDAAIFGALAALACLAKGNGISVVLMPAFLILLTRRFDVLRRGGLYLSAAIVVVFAVPFLALAYHLDGPLGDFGPVTLRLVLERAAFYGRHIWLQLGALPVLFAAVGFAGAIRAAAAKMSALMPVVALVALVLGTSTFHLLNPHILSHERYIALALAPILGLAAYGVTIACRPLRLAPARTMAQVLLFAIMGVANTADAWPAAQRPLGYRAVAAYLNSQSLAGRRVLVVSDEYGEGACVTEVAVVNAHPRPMVIRGSKLLASDDWMGRNLVVKYESPDALLADLEAMHIEFVVLDLSAGARERPYWEAVAAIPERFPARMVPAFSPGLDPERGPIRSIQVYRLTTLPEGAPRPVPMSLPGAASDLGVTTP